MEAIGVHLPLSHAISRRRDSIHDAFIGLASSHSNPVPLMIRDSGDQEHIYKSAVHGIHFKNTTLLAYFWAPLRNIFTEVMAL